MTQLCPAKIVFRQIVLFTGSANLGNEYCAAIPPWCVIQKRLGLSLGSSYGQIESSTEEI